jgi:hypothetical protein
VCFLTREEILCAELGVGQARLCSRRPRGGAYRGEQPLDALPKAPRGLLVDLGDYERGNGDAWLAGETW